MPAASVTDIMDELASVLEDALGASMLGDDGFQVVPRMNLAPSEPSIDVYPADPFTTIESEGFGDVSGTLQFIVRARVAGDADGRQDLLLSLMDDESSMSVAAIIEADTTLGGLATSLEVDGPSGYVLYESATGTLLGCEFRVGLIRARS